MESPLKPIPTGLLTSFINIPINHSKCRTAPLWSLLPEHEIWSIFCQISAAIEHLHSKRIIHRDLKPANILITMQGCVKLSDFGLSCFQNSRSRLLTVCGTPYYMAPERISEEPYTSKSDMWSLGCILYEVCLQRERERSSDRTDLQARR